MLVKMQIEKSYRTMCKMFNYFFDKGDKVMGEEIEAGTMVWCRDNGQGWQTVKREYIGTASNGLHVCWRNGEPLFWSEITTENPHQPKQPEWMPGDEYELWERVEADYGTIRYKASGKSVFYVNPESKPGFHSFAVQAGDGEVHLINSPVWYTWDGATLYQSFSPNSYQAKLLGAVMKKAVE